MAQVGKLLCSSTRQFYLQRYGWEGGDDIDDDNLWVGWQVIKFMYKH